MASATPQQPEARETAADEEDEAESEVPQVARRILLTVCHLLHHNFGKLVHLLGAAQGVAGGFPDIG